MEVYEIYDKLGLEDPHEFFNRNAIKYQGEYRRGGLTTTNIIQALNLASTTSGKKILFVTLNFTMVKYIRERLDVYATILGIDSSNITITPKNYLVQLQRGTNAYNPENSIWIYDT